MKIDNPFQMNDWEIKKFLKVVLTVQLVMLCIVGLDFLGLQIPILRQFMGFIYLTFVPGILILRIFRLHKLGNIETVLITVGLSIAILMFVGLFTNTVYPFFGILRPISTTSLMITISIIILILCIICYIIDKDFFNPDSIDVEDILSPPALFLCLIPFLAVFGTYLVNFYYSNIILIVMIIVVALIIILIGFDTFIPKNLYPLAVFIIAITLLFHNSLISMYIWGWDIHIEYYLSSLVTTSARWDPTIPLTVNAMLSIVILAPIFSNICGMSLTWVFKIIYPLLFSLVPLGLYKVFQKQTDDKIAILSCFFFMSVFMFYTEMLGLARQQIAELFLILMMLLMISKNINCTTKAGLSIIFAFSLAVSHYGLSYIFMFSLIAAGGLFFLNMQYRDQNNTIKRIITPTFVLLCITFTIAWYTYVSSSSAFNTIIRIGDHIISNIFTDFLNPDATQGLNIILSKAGSSLCEVAKYLHLLTQFFIVIGVRTLLLKRSNMKFEKEYVAFAATYFAICFASITVPFFASALNTTRLYQISLIFLAPFFVIGVITSFKAISNVIGVHWTDSHIGSSLKVLSVFLSIFLLFNTQFVMQIAKDHPSSISLSQKWIKESGNARDRNSFYGEYHPEQDIFGVKWLSKNRNNKLRLYADIAHVTHSFVSYGMMPYQYILTNTTIVVKDSYVYMGYANVHYGLMYGVLKKKEYWWNLADLSPSLDEINIIYSNGGAQVYYR